MKRLFYNRFYRVYRFSRWLSRRLTPNGMILLTATVLSAAIGIDTKSNLSSLLFSFLAILLFLSVLTSRKLTLRLKLQRELPAFATVNEPLQYQIAITNQGKTPTSEIKLIDQLKDQPPSFEHFSETPYPNHLKVNIFDRFIGYPKWAWLNTRYRGGNIKEVSLPNLKAGHPAKISLSFTPIRRGTIRFEEYWMLRKDPLGLVNAIQKIQSADTLTVLPRRYPISMKVLDGSSALQPGGVSLASHTGDSEEFISLRDYRPGDSLRSVHWKSWAKTGKPVIKETQPEFFVRNALILDNCIENRWSEHFEEAVSVATSFILTLDTRENLIDLLFVGDQPCQLTMGRGTGHKNELLKAIANAQIAAPLKFKDLVHKVMAHSRYLSGCILVFSQWDEQRKQLVGSLKHNRINCLPLVVCNDDNSTLESLQEAGCFPLPLSSIETAISSL